MPLLLDADTLTEAIATAILSPDREEKISWTAVLISSGNAWSSGDADLAASPWSKANQIAGPGLVPAAITKPKPRQRQQARRRDRR